MHACSRLSRGEVFVGSFDMKLHAVEAQTGKRLWTYATGGQVSSSPAVGKSDGKQVVFVGSADGRLHAVEAVTGRGLWTYAASGGDVSASPVVGNAGKVVFVGGSDQKLHAVVANRDDRAEEL